MSHESYAIPRTNSSPRFDFELPAAGDRQLYFQLTLVVDRWLHSQLLVAGDHWLHYELQVAGDRRLHSELPVAGDRHPVTVLPLTDRQVVQLYPGHRPLTRLLPPETKTKSLSLTFIITAITCKLFNWMVISYSGVSFL